MSKRGGMPGRARLATSGSESANKRGVYLDYDFFQRNSGAARSRS